MENKLTFSEFNCTVSLETPRMPSQYMLLQLSWEGSKLRTLA